MKRYKQGIYSPIHPEKYNGSKPIIYRSGLELSFMRHCDNNSNILKWGSESVIIPYISPVDGRLHRYFIDFNLTLSKDNKIQKYLVEIKPASQLQPPKKSPRKKETTILREQVMFAVNNAKWAKAREWCDKNNYKFIIVTEKDLKK